MFLIFNEASKFVEERQISIGSAEQSAETFLQFLNLLAAFASLQTLCKGKWKSSKVKFMILVLES